MARQNEERLPGRTFPDQLTITDDLGAAVGGAGAVFLAATSDQIVDVAREAAVHAGAEAAFVICAKGLTREGGFLTDAVARVRPAGPVLFLSGPSFAHEVAEGRRTIVTLAGPVDDAWRVASAFSSETLVIAPSTDVCGVQVAGVFKNVAAILCGAADGLGAGANTRAALMSEAIREAAAVVQAVGGDSGTLLGPAGFGDFALTCTDPQSRNYSLGRDIAGGLQGDGATHEGAVNSSPLLDLAERAGIEVPLAEVVADLVAGRIGAEEAIESAFARRLAKSRRAVRAA
jgi:glycerol-3-phosphate dehydrogenase (NAD(P)+)